MKRAGSTGGDESEKTILPLTKSQKPAMALQGDMKSPLKRFHDLPGLVRCSPIYLCSPSKSHHAHDTVFRSHQCGQTLLLNRKKSEDFWFLVHPGDHDLLYDCDLRIDRLAQ